MISEQLRGARVALQEHEPGFKSGREKREKGRGGEKREDRINRDRKVSQKRWYEG